MEKKRNAVGSCLTLFRPTVYHEQLSSLAADLLDFALHPSDFRGVGYVNDPFRRIERQISYRRSVPPQSIHSVCEGAAS